MGVAEGEGAAAEDKEGRKERRKQMQAVKEQRQRCVLEQPG